MILYSLIYTAASAPSGAVCSTGGISWLLSTLQAMVSCSVQGWHEDCFEAQHGGG